MTPKQQRFVQEYLIDLNATQAAIRAGYSKKTAGQIGDEILKKPETQAALHQAMKRREKRTEITQDRVLQELAKIGFADIRKAVKWGESVAVPIEPGAEPVMMKHTVALLSSDQIDDDIAAAIAEVSESREGVKIKLHDKKGALVDIGRHLGMFKDKIDITSNGQTMQSGVLVAPPVLPESDWEKQQ